MVVCMNFKYIIEMFSRHTHLKTHIQIKTVQQTHSQNQFNVIINDN